MADLHAENNITRLTKPFFSLDRTIARASLTHTYSTQSTLNQADMCSAQPVITRALMWSLGAAEASYYCRFMTTLTQTVHPTVPPLSPRSLPLHQATSICLWQFTRFPHGLENLGNLEKNLPIFLS